MSIYSAFFDSVKQKEEVLGSDDHIGLIKDFRAKLKMDYLIYGSVVFTDAQIFDGAVFHAMLNEDDHYWIDFVDFIKTSSRGSILIKHGNNSLSERIDYCLGKEDFELSSLAIYDEATISEVNLSRNQAVDAGMVTYATDNQFYYNISQIKNTLERDEIKNRNVFSSWDAPENRHHMLRLFQGNSSYYTSFMNQLNSFKQQLQQYKEFGALKPTIANIENQFNPKITDLIPRRSDWKVDIDNLIKESDNDDFIELANKLLLFLSDCYITLCAHQHECQFASLESPFSLEPKDRLLTTNEWSEIIKRLKKTIQQQNILGIYLSDELLQHLREESFADFLSNIRRDQISNPRKKWLESLYDKSDQFDGKLLNDLIGEVYSLYYPSHEVRKYQNIGQDMTRGTINSLLELADLAIPAGILMGSQLDTKPAIFLLALTAVYKTVKIVKFLKPLYDEQKDYITILTDTKSTGKDVVNQMNLQKVTQFDNMICKP